MGVARVGLIARATDSGLGTLSKDFYDHLHPDECLVITDADARYRDHLDRFPGAATARYDTLDRTRFDGWMSGCDVVWSFETLYSPAILDAARRVGTRTVLMGMPELTRMRKDRGWFGDPDQFVWPTTWLIERLPGTVLPVPVIPRRWQKPRERLSIVHVAGAPAVGDRNGTKLFLAALRHITAPVDVRICADRLDSVAVPVHGQHVDIEVWGHVGDRFEMYEDRDLLVLPRRYGGLSLPVLEALAGGLAVMMPATSPQNTDWPILPVECQANGSQRTPVGLVPRVLTQPEAIAAAIDRAAYDRRLVDKATEAARRWAWHNSWAALTPSYELVLGGLCRSM